MSASNYPPGVTGSEPEIAGESLCEDYPCCGHTPLDPCQRQWYDEPGAFDTSRPGNEHALCDHENGDCSVDDFR